MAITKMTGRTYEMLLKDKRVDKVLFGDTNRVAITLQTGWSSDNHTTKSFDNWEAARNWVRKAVEVKA